MNAKRLPSHLYHLDLHKIFYFSDTWRIQLPLLQWSQEPSMALQLKKEKRLVLIHGSCFLYEFSRIFFKKMDLHKYKVTEKCSLAGEFKREVVHCFHFNVFSKQDLIRTGEHRFFK